MSNATYKKGELSTALKKKGFRSENGGNHEKFYFYVGGKKSSVRTLLPYGSDKDLIRSTLFSQIKKQMHFKKPEQLENFIVCTMSEEEYLKFLIVENKIKLG